MLELINGGAIVVSLMIVAYIQDLNDEEEEDK